MEDLSVGMVLSGVVRNVVDFGVFVDIGVHQDGLVHISQITDRYISHPREVLKVGDQVEVRVLGVDLERKKISLSMKKEGVAAPAKKGAIAKPNKTASVKVDAVSYDDALGQLLGRFGKK